MKMSAITVKFGEQKLQALQLYADKKEVSVTDELTDSLNKLYEKHVPVAVREFIDILSDEDTKKKDKAKPKVDSPRPVDNNADIDNKPDTPGFSNGGKTDERQ